ncbi:hypothetical protein E0E54_06005 [Azotobacter chroococcum]|uniref:hypothetical protein n=1 Tax=Azotobacter chroococcum TaxID=353 RepID=UPI001038A9F6|nr:hypothetical protein [Azotobacter chroococcum]TBW37773.1 hypothetical protein E0E54_06005 [Azotobacter chroococcum]
MSSHSHLALLCKWSILQLYLERHEPMGQRPGGIGTALAILGGTIGAGLRGAVALRTLGPDWHIFRRFWTIPHLGCWSSRAPCHVRGSATCWFFGATWLTQTPALSRGQFLGWLLGQERRRTAGAGR